MSNLYILEHPLIQSKMSLLRDTSTGNKEFRELVKEIATLICYEATKNLPLKKIEVNTPLSKTKGSLISTEVGLIPILRAGMGMVEGILSLIPNAKVGHIGLYRDPETLMPIEYYCKLPIDADKMEIFILDPMLATGGTASAAIQFLKERGIKNIKFICLLSAPEGIKKVQSDHPDIDIYTAALDDGINEHGYIIPGLGDAGDRLYGTK